MGPLPKRLHQSTSLPILSEERVDRGRRNSLQVVIARGAHNTYKDGIVVTQDSPEAMEEPLWMSFFPDAHNPQVSNVIMPGDLLHCDFGITYLRLNTDMQQLAYVLKPGETEVPEYLQKPDLTNLLTAQAAELSGDTKKAEETYKKLITADSTRFVGVRGIMKQKLAQGDTDTARKLAEKAFELKPKHEETQDVLLKLQAQAQDWAGARKTLSTKLKTGTLPRDVHRRRDAILALSEARDVIADPDAGAKLPMWHPYLALLPVGLAVPVRLPVPRWALTPPFHPYLPAKAV